MTVSPGSSKQRTRIAIIATLFGLLLIVAMSIGAFFSAMSVLDQPYETTLARLTGFNGHMFLQPIEGDASESDGLASAIARVRGVRYAMPIVEGAALLSSSTTQGGVLVRGIGERDLKHLPSFGGRPIDGTFEGFDEIDGVAIGQTLADNLGVRIGDKVGLIFAKAADSDKPSIERPIVTAIFATGLPQIDATFVLMPLARASSFFKRAAPAGVIIAFLEDPEATDAVRGRIETSTPAPLVITDWRERNKTFLGSMQKERLFVSWVVGFITAAIALGLTVGLISLARVWTR